MIDISIAIEKQQRFSTTVSLTTIEDLRATCWSIRILFLSVFPYTESGKGVVLSVKFYRLTERIGSLEKSSDESLPFLISGLEDFGGKNHLLGFFLSF